MKTSLAKESVWKTHRKDLLVVFGGVLLGTLILLFIFNMVPAELELNPTSSDNNSNQQAALTQDSKTMVLPGHIKIPKIGVDVSVSNPESDNVSALDEYLKKGSVRYPGSGSLSSGNMFLFAHSTGFKVVQNQAYKAFNNLKDLLPGDPIYVKGDDGIIYLYKVSSVKLASDKDVLVRFDKASHMLTLSTCNTFGKKEERYVVEAYFEKMNVDSLTF